MKWRKFILSGLLIMGAAIVAVPFCYQIYGRIRTNQLISEFESHINQAQSDIRDPPGDIMETEEAGFSVGEIL